MILQKKPVLDHFTAIRCQDTFWMELDAAYVQILVLQSHNLPFVTLCRHLQAVRKSFPTDHPGVIASHRDATGKSREKGIVAKLGTYSCYAMKYVAEVFQLATKYLANGLMAQTYT